jgi:hypothetical protein
MLWAIAGIQSERLGARVWGFLLLLYSVGLKEVGPPLLSALGMAWALGAGPEQTRAFTRRVGIVFIPLGIVLLYVDLALIPPLFGMATHNHRNEYQQFGPSLVDVVLSPILQPKLFVSHLVSESRLKFLFWTLAPLGFLPLLNPRALVLALPGYLLLFLSTAEYRITPIFHYAIIPAVGLFFALPGALVKAAQKGGLHLLVVWVLFWSLGANGRSDWFRVREMDRSKHAVWLSDHLIPSIDPNVDLSAPSALVPHLFARQWVATFPRVTDAANQPLPCVLIDDGVKNLDLAPGQLQAVESQLQSSGYERVLSCGSFRAYEKKRGQEGRGCFSSAANPCDE